MNTRVVLQIPMTKELKEAAEKEAKKQGFSSLQEVLRIFVNKFARNEIIFTFIDIKGEFVSLKKRKSSLP